MQSKEVAKCSKCGLNDHTMSPNEQVIANLKLPAHYGQKRFCDKCYSRFIIEKTKRFKIAKTKKSISKTSSSLESFHLSNTNSKTIESNQSSSVPINSESFVLQIPNITKSKGSLDLENVPLAKRRLSSSNTQRQEVIEPELVSDSDDSDDEDISPNIGRRMPEVQPFVKKRRLAEVPLFRDSGAPRLNPREIYGG